MAAIQSLCQRCMIIEAGRVQLIGEVTETINKYLNAQTKSSVFKKEPKQAGVPELCSASIISVASTEQNRVEVIAKLGIQCAYEFDVNVDFRIRDNRGTPLGFATLGNMTAQRPVILSAGMTYITVTIDVTSLAVGAYTMSIDVSTPFVNYHDRCEDCLDFSIDAEHWPRVLHPLRQEWQLGSVSLPCRLDPQSLKMGVASKKLA